MTSVKVFLEKAVQEKASDIYIVSGKAVSIKVYGKLVPSSDVLSQDDSEKCVRELYDMAERDFSKLARDLDDDFSVSCGSLGRFRVNVYIQNGSYASVIRTVPNSIPDAKALNLPKTVLDLTNLTKGIVLVTGPTGSGKTTTLACLIDKINQERDCHIVTVEDPIEFRHPHKNSVISQRELEKDTRSFLNALRAALRQAPDVILIGEMRDLETVETAITAAETGHLVFSTLHTMGAASTIDRIIDSFPADRQNQIRTQLSMTLQAVVSQQLLPNAMGKISAAFEIMTATPALRNLIRENKIFQIDNIIQTSVNIGMKTLDMSLSELVAAKLITAEQALAHCANPSNLKLAGAQSPRVAPVARF